MTTASTQEVTHLLMAWLLRELSEEKPGEV